MARSKKKLYAELNELFPVQFPDNEEERTALMQESLILGILETIRPDDPTLPDRKKGLVYDVQQLNKPAVLVGPGNALDAIRQSYVDNLNTMQSENLRVSNTTTSIDYWHSVDWLKRKYNPKTNSQNAATE